MLPMKGKTESGQDIDLRECRTAGVAGARARKCLVGINNAWGRSLGIQFYLVPQRNHERIVMGRLVRN